ncbi:metallophosphoesterase [Alkaliphilus hydrothermalis]|uniref:Phosphodiesterase n=1 Tax=Alkaliphilus hydrothermalis TaxID=1482730 RepID=A0ABS2NPX1_9FIRM|nr:metallophosphoesterase [Alkaliphilus hydrothermalis]MBM7614990.1 putative phosphodiesterase [Alkaliphilus hydrothermalis]
MRIFKIIEKIKCFILDRPYIPEELKRKKTGPLLLHISDTPAEIFPFIERLIKEINPQYIVHTGDIVDNIKLETNDKLLESYKVNLRKIVRIIEENSNAKIYYAVGNHDHEETLKRTIKTGYILEKGIINIEGNKIYMGHYFQEVESGTDYCLYGHSFEPSHFQQGNRICLNGVLSANIIDLHSKKIYQIEYPFATNRLRRMEKGRITI